MQQSDASTTVGSNNSRMVPGYVVILTVLGLSVAASLFSWFYYRRLQERPIALWGSQAAALMLRAPVAHAYRLAPAGEDASVSGQRLTICGEEYVVREESDISAARGFSHVRHGLIHDRSFAWDEPPANATPHWDYAIAFADGDSQAAVAFDSGSGEAVLIGGTRRVSMRPVAAEIADFLREQFPATVEAEPSQAR